jgi:Predicted transcriptional regulator
MARNPVIKVKTPKIDYHKLLVRMYDRKWTRKSLAKSTGVSETALGYWIGHGELMHGTVIVAIAYWLEIPLSEIAEYFFQEDKAA